MTSSQGSTLTDFGQLALSEEAFRDVASKLAAGVVVVSTNDDGFDHAMTATSFTTLSLDPLLAMVSVQRDTRFHDAICGLDGNFGEGLIPDSPGSGTRAGHGWAVSVLPEAAVPMASWFATKGRPLVDQFARFDHHRGDATDCVVFDDAIAWLELRTKAQYPAGDHTLVIGEIVALGINQFEKDDDAADPLVHWARRYKGLGS